MVFLFVKLYFYLKSARSSIKLLLYMNHANKIRSEGQTNLHVMCTVLYHYFNSEIKKKINNSNKKRSLNKTHSMLLIACSKCHSICTCYVNCNIICLLNSNIKN